MNEVRTPWFELLCAACFITAFLLVALGMFGNVEGGNMDSAVWFPWHPVLMALSYPCCMGLGRLAYIARLDLSINVRRAWHGSCMALGVLAALLGYYAIFKAHWPKSQFFGYDFATHEWKPMSRIVHSLLGYVIIIASVIQGMAGPMKIRAIRAGQRVFTWHGTLGKRIIVAAMVNLLLAVYFWGWSMRMKLPLGLVLLGSGLLARLLPRHMGPQIASQPLVTATGPGADDTASNEMTELAASS
mmetsp:Transcript_62107/g.115209  ORF Transcript_62107/g.115209 Transcript_62107/m.115209 type:complete len:244 (+) Transcript_62107:146-877(+)